MEDANKARSAPAVLDTPIACPVCGRWGVLLRLAADAGAAVVVHGARDGGGGVSVMTTCAAPAWPAGAPIAGRDE